VSLDQHTDPLVLRGTYAQLPARFAPDPLAAADVTATEQSRPKLTDCRFMSSIPILKRFIEEIPGGLNHPHGSYSASAIESRCVTREQLGREAKLEQMRSPVAR